MNISTSTRIVKVFDPFAIQLIATTTISATTTEPVASTTAVITP